MADINLSDILSTTTGTTTNISPSTPATNATLDLHPSVGAIQSSINFYQDDGVTLVADFVVTTAGGLSISSPVNLSLQGQYWPSADGATGQILSTDGNGNLSWINNNNSSPDVIDYVVLASFTETVDSVSLFGLKAVKWIVTIKNSTLGKIISFEILAHNKFGLDVDYNIYSRMGDKDMQYGVDIVINGGFMELNITNGSIHSYDVSVNKNVLGG